MSTTETIVPHSTELCKSTFYVIEPVELEIFGLAVDDLLSSAGYPLTLLCEAYGSLEQAYFECENKYDKHPRAFVEDFVSSIKPQFEQVDLSTTQYIKPKSAYKAKQGDNTTSNAIEPVKPVYTALEQVYAAIPSELRMQRIWHTFKLELAHTNADGTKKYKKAPMCTAWYNKDTYRSFNDAVSYANGLDSRGIGLVLDGVQSSDGLSILMIDLDECVNQGQIVTKLASRVAELLKNETYGEISQSQRGVKFFGLVDQSTLELVSNTPLPKGLELHYKGFAALTGQTFANCPSNLINISEEIQTICNGLQAKASQEAPQATKKQNPTYDKGDSAQRRVDGLNDVIIPFNTTFDALTVLEQFGAKVDRATGGRAGKLWHCPCGVHSGSSGSLIIKVSNNPVKFGQYVVHAKNASCCLYNNDRPISAFNVLQHLGCNGDYIKALDTAREWLGLPDFEQAKIKSSVVYKSNPVTSQPVECPKTALETIVASVRQKMALDTTLTNSQRIILESFIDCADNKATSSFSFDTLVLVTQASRSTVIRSIKALVSSGYIRKYTQGNVIGGNDANVYQLVECQNNVTPLVDSGLTVVSTDNQLLGIDENNTKIDVIEPENSEKSSKNGSNDTPLLNIQKGKVRGNSINTDFECNEKSDLNRVATKKADSRKGDVCQLAHPLTLPTENVEQFCYEVILGLVAKQKTNKLVWASDKTKVSRITKQRVIMALAEYFDLATIEQAYLPARDEADEFKQAFKRYCSLDIDTLRIEIDAKRLTNASMNMKRKDSRLHHALVRMAEKIYSSKLRKQSR